MKLITSLKFCHLLARLKALTMTAVKNNFNRTCHLLVLVFCILCPIYVFAEKDGTKKSKDPATNQQNQAGANQQSPTPSKQDETLMKDLFKDATYENFASQEKAAEQKPFDEGYLEPRK